MDDIRNKLDLMDGKLDKIDSRLDKVEVNQAVMNQDLKYHIKRTNILENDLKPIYSKYQQFKGIAKFISGVASACAIIEAIIHAGDLIKFFSHFLGQ